jgi:hypothetical protein
MRGFGGLVLLVALLASPGECDDNPCVPVSANPNRCALKGVCPKCCETFFVPRAQCTACLDANCPVWKCDGATGKCTQDYTAVGQMGPDCSRACQQTYSCSLTTGACTVDAKGTQTKTACSSTCKATPPPTPAPLPYDCDKTSYTCAPKAGGAFTSNSTCMANCIMPTPPPPTMYSCNAITGDCFVDAKGTQTQAGCAKACKGTTVPTPRPTAPRGPTPAPAPAKSTAVPLGLGLGLGVPAVAGGLWYHRQRQQAANNHVNHELVTGSGGTAGFYDAL